MEILVKMKCIKLNPISLMYYVSPCREVEDGGQWHMELPFPSVTLNSLCTFALNLSVFLVISRTNALTIGVVGIVKDWVVVLVSALLFADIKLTVIILFCYAIAIASVPAYNNHKLKKEASPRVTTETPGDD
ncbi:hypothetical protein F2Q69_00041920, partial [Brassica cretica]